MNKNQLIKEMTNDGYSYEGSTKNGWEVYTSHLRNSDVHVGLGLQFNGNQCAVHLSQMGDENFQLGFSETNLNVQIGIHEIGFTFECISDIINTVGGFLDKIDDEVCKSLYPTGGLC